MTLVGAAISFANELSGEDFPVPTSFRTSETGTPATLIHVGINKVGKALVQGYDNPAAAALERVGQPDITVLPATSLHDFPLSVFMADLESIAGSGSHLEWMIP